MCTTRKKHKHSLGHDKYGTAKAFAKQGARDFSEKSCFDLFTKEAARQQLSVVRIPNIPWQTFKDTLVEYQLTRRCWCILRFFTIERYFFTEVFLQHSIESILENGLTPAGHESDKGRQIVFFTSHHLTFVVEILQKKNLMVLTQFRENAITVFGNEIKMQYIGEIIPSTTDRGLQLWQKKSQPIIVHSPCASRLHLQSSF